MSSQDGFMSTLFSPPVIMIGAGLGLLILVLGKTGGSPSTTSVGASPAALSATVQMNQVAANAQIQYAQISAQAGQHTQDVNVQSQGQILGYLENISNNNTVFNQTVATSQAGITNHQITASATLAQDINDNNARMFLAQQQAAVSMDQTQGATNIATIQANAAKSIAKTQAISSIVGNVVGGVTKVATMGFG